MTVEAPDHHHTHASRSRIIGSLRALIAPHSHDALDAMDQSLSANDDGMRALKRSLAVLGATAALQLAIMFVSGSIALVSDSVHNVADALTAVPLGLAFWLGRKPPNRRYTFGYGRTEDVAGIFIVLTIAASALVAGYAAVERLVHPQAVHHIGWVIAAGLVGFAGNEVVALYRIRVGGRIGSAALVADGHHARTDGITSLAVVAGAIGVAAGWQAADPIAGLLITVGILGILKNAAHDVYRRLVDSVDPTLVDRVEDVLAGVPGVEHVETVRIRWVGHELWAEAVVVSDGQLSLEAAHGIAEEAHHRLLHRIPRLAEALIHSDPGPVGGEERHALTAHHFAQQASRR